MTKDSLKEAQFLNNEIEVLESKLRAAKQFLAGDVRYRDSLAIRFEDTRDTVLSCSSARYVSGDTVELYVKERATLVGITNEKILKFTIECLEAYLEILRKRFTEM